MRTSYSQEQFSRTKAIAKIIGDASNILILYELMNFGEKSFNELKRMTEINAVTLSKKLTVLRTKGYVDYRECGKENHYFTTSKASEIAPLIQDIEKLIMNT